MRPTAAQQLWIIDVYSLVLAGLLVSTSSLGDRFGRKRMLLLGYVVFGVASASVLWAETPGQVIALRAALGVGGAMIMPTTLTMLRVIFTDPAERAKALGLWTAVSGVGAAVGAGEARPPGRRLPLLEGHGETIPAAQDDDTTRQLEVHSAFESGISLAQCCYPLPQEPIIGQIVPGIGIHIHRQECPLRGIDGNEEWISATWAQERKGLFPAALEIEAYEHPRLLADVSSHIADADTINQE